MLDILAGFLDLLMLDCLRLFTDIPETLQNWVIFHLSFPDVQDCLAVSRWLDASKGSLSSFGFLVGMKGVIPFLHL
jgi:hypothetical protein